MGRKYVAGHYRVGDRVKFLDGTKKVIGIVRENRGPIGVGGRRLYLVEDAKVADFLMEIPEEELELADPRVSRPA